MGQSPGRCVKVTPWWGAGKENLEEPLRAVGTLQDRGGERPGKLLGSESLRAVGLPVRGLEQKLLAGLKLV